MFATQVLPSATILLTGLSGAGKTTLAEALVRRLADEGVDNVVLVDGEALRARLPRQYGHSMAERDAVWREIVRQARADLAADKVVVIATIAHKTAMRADARRQLQPFYEVHVDCPVEVCAARDVKGHYRRAHAGEYDCFIGVTHPYERSNSADLRIDTSVFALEQAQSLLAERVLDFLSKPAGGSTVSWPVRLGRWLEEVIVDSPMHWRRPDLRRRDLLARAPASKSVVRMDRKGCAQLVLLYGGMDAYLGTQGMFSGMSPLEFLRLSGLFGRNLLWIRDPHGVDFTRGISDEVASIDALAAWTRTQMRLRPQVSEVHTLGYSSGSYGALMFGHLCRVDTVWAFSPRTARVEEAEASKARLREMLSVHNGVTQYHLWFAHRNRRDRAFAESLADCPGVTLHPSREGGNRHYLIRHLAERGDLRTILPPFVPAVPTLRQPAAP